MLKQENRRKADVEDEIVLATYGRVRYAVNTNVLLALQSFLGCMDWT